MATETTQVLVRNADGSPALWVDIVDTHLIREDGTRYHDYTGSTLNDDNTSITFDPSVEDLEVCAEQWKSANA